MEEDLAEVRSLLKEHGQEHMLDHWDDGDVTDEQKRALLHDLLHLDFAETCEAFKKSSLSSSSAVPPSPTNHSSGLGPPEAAAGPSSLLDDRMQPLDEECYSSAARCSPEQLEEYWNLTLDHVSEGRVGVLLLAGGQGTRLGVPYPKGMYDIGLLSGKSLYQVQVERMLRIRQLADDARKNRRRRRSGGGSPGEGSTSRIPLYVMTSEHTMAPTEEFFRRHRHFGARPEDVVFFEQRMIPSFDLDGKVILEDKARVAKSPDGNGGLYRALKFEGILEDMEGRGVKYLHVYCVDNVLVRVADPHFVGYCIASGCQVGNKVVKKTLPTEAVGVMCRVDGKYQVVEYSEVSAETAEARDSHGDLLYKAGNICNHFFTIDFLKDVVHRHELPYHPARKTIPSVGGVVKSGIKLEKFVFDAFRFADRFVVWECDRDQEFSPLKNAPGAGTTAAKDTPATARRDLFRLHRWYVEQAGGTFEPRGTGEKVDEGHEDVRCEISPLLSYMGEGLEAKVKGKAFLSASVLIDEKADNLTETTS